MNRSFLIGWGIYAYSKSKEVLSYVFNACISTIVTLLLISSATLQAQSDRWIDLNPGEWTLDLPSGYFYEGDTVVYSLLLRDISSPVDNLIAVELHLELSDYALIPAGMIPDTIGSWLFSDGEFSYNVEQDAALTTLDILAEREDGTSKTGHGKVFSFELICNGNSLKASDLILSDGGIILVENIELKRGDPSGPMVVDDRNNPIVLIQVLGLEQQKGYRAEWRMVDGVAPQISGLPSGLYFLRERMMDGSVRTRKILVR